MEWNSRTLNRYCSPICITAARSCQHGWPRHPACGLPAMPEGRRHRLVRVPSGVRDRGVQRADRRDDHRARFHRLSGPDQRGVYGAMWRCRQRREEGGQRCPPRKKEFGNGKEQERPGDGHVPRAREHGRAARAQDRAGRGRVRPSSSASSWPPSTPRSPITSMFTWSATTTAPTKRPPCKAGWPTTRASTCTTPQPIPAGSTRSSAGSPN